jgi:16S rRNA (adenine1518-N6/adenine1519-N6)-dimethyltransferase
MSPPLKLDQHFLKDNEVLDKIIGAADIKNNDLILEIGAGKGFLTAELAKKAEKIIAVELDAELKSFLDQLPSNVEVRYGNALELIHKVKFNKIVANIPYAISEPLFRKLIKLNFELAVLLIGKNFYDILSKDSMWSVIANVFFEISKIADVPRVAFRPRPRTDSVVISLRKRQSQLSTREQITKEFVLQDDKKVFNALAESFVRTQKLTQKQAKAKVFELSLPEELLDKKVAYLSERQFMAVYAALSS